MIADRVRRRAVATALLVTGFLMTAGSMTALARTAANGVAKPAFEGFFQSAAEASGIGAIFAPEGSEPHNPTFGGTVPETVALLDTSSGFAVASLAWPGPLAANAGNVANLLLPACTPTQLPVSQECAPSPDPELVKAANYPVRAEAASGSNNEDEVGPMRAEATNETAQAEATIADFVSPSVVSAGEIFSRSQNVIEDDRVVTLAETTMTGVEIAAGVITIDSIKTTARASSDGEDPQVERETVVSGVEVDGQPARIDEDGLHFGGERSDNPLAAPIDEFNSQMLSEMGMEVFLTEPVEETEDDGAARVHSGSLAFTWVFGEEGSENQITVTLGGAFARVSASSGTSFDFGDIEIDDDIGGEFGSLGSSGSTTGSTGTGGASVASGSIGSDGSSAAPPDPAPAPPPDAQSEVAFGGVPAAQFFDGNSPALVLLALIGVLLAGVGLKQFQTAALIPAAAAPCGIDGRTP